MSGGWRCRGERIVCLLRRGPDDGIVIRMSHRITRDRMLEAIRELPADASVDDAIERLVFLAKIEEGLEQLDKGQAIPHDEVKRRLQL